MSNLLATKLHCPALPPRWVPRPHIVERLNQGLESGRRITLISAPAGFGKTFSASEWVNILDMPVAWLSLDAADDDPGRFFSYLIAALQNVDEDIGGEIEGILRAGQLPPGEIISTTLVNDINALEQRFLIILDDFQVVQDKIILDVLDILVTNAPPSLHLVLLTREDPPLPLARQRANNQLTEIRASDLRFSSAEAGRFLNQVMDLGLSGSDIKTLEDKTEGWIVGLQLAGLSLRDRVTPSAYIANLSGGHRFILSYLTEEVLNRQPQDIQQFLMSTSILERLNGDLCNAITGRVDSHSLLERLLEANLFLVPLDDEGDWYRYHQLFADLLRDRQAALQLDNTSELHLRASHWYAQQGVGEERPFINQAIEHALAGGDYSKAVGMIERHAMDMVMQWHLKTVEGWMRAIPAEWCANSAEANLAFALVHVMHGNFPEAGPYLGRLQVLFADPEGGPLAGGANPALEARWLALQCMLLNGQGKAAESLQLAKRALEIVPAQDGQVQGMIHLGLATAYQQLEDYEKAVEAFQTIIQLGVAAGNSVTELIGISGLALLAIQHGQYHYAYEITSQGMERIERAGSLPPISTAVYGELAVIHYQWHQLDLAHHFFNRSIQVSVLSGYSDAEIYYGVILSRLFQIQGDLDAAAKELDKVVDLMQVEAPTAVREEAINQQVRIYLAQDRPTEAERILEKEGFSFQAGFSFPDLRTNLDQNRSRGILYISALHILLYQAQVKQESGSLQSGIELANYLIETTLDGRYIPFALEVLLLRARLHAEIGDEQASREDILHALVLGEPEGFISIFLEGGLSITQALADMLKTDQLGSVHPGYVERILAASPAPGQSPRGKPVDPGATLTGRELDVLRLMAEGLKYNEIAERLYISLNTVRTHVKAIYGKLGVDNRTKAIEQAHKLGIL